MNRVNSNFKDAYRAVPIPHLVVTKLFCKESCFACTKLSIFKDLEMCTDTFMRYIRAALRVRVCSYIQMHLGISQHQTLDGRESTVSLESLQLCIQVWGKAQYSATRAVLRRSIKAAKEDYKNKIDHLTHNNPRQVWEGLRQITNYKENTPVSVELNNSF